MAKMTSDYLDGLDAKGKLYRVPVDGCRNLYLQVTGKPGAPVRSWVFRYRLRGKDGSYTIGRYPEVSTKKAMGKADVLRTDIKDGKDPNEIRKATRAKAKPVPVSAPIDTTPLFRAVAEDFFNGHVKVKNQPSMQKYQRWALDKRVLPVLGEMKVTDVTAQVITKFLDDLAGTPVTANRVKSLLSKMFNWAGRRVDVLSGASNPAQGHERHTETPRERRLTEDEIRAIGESYRGTGEYWGPGLFELRHALVFLLLTGARSGVVLCQTSSNQFPEEKMLRFDPKTPGLKGCRAVFLPAAAVKILPKIPFGIDRNHLWRSWLHLRPDGCKCSIHDLRRTFASIGADLGYDEALVDAVLGHSRGKIRDTYFHRADPTLLAVTEKIGGHIAELLGIAKSKKEKVTQGVARHSVPAQDVPAESNVEDGESDDSGPKSARMIQARKGRGTGTKT